MNQPSNKRKFAATVERFLAKHLGGACELSIEEQSETNLSATVSSLK